MTTTTKAKTVKIKQNNKNNKNQKTDSTTVWSNPFFVSDNHSGKNDLSTNNDNNHKNNNSENSES